MRLIIEVETLVNGLEEPTGKYNISGAVQCKSEEEYQSLNLPFVRCTWEDEQGVYDSFYYKEKILKHEIAEHRAIIKKLYKEAKYDRLSKK